MEGERMGPGRSLVVIAASDDEAMGEHGASLDGEVGYEKIDAIVQRALELDTSARSLRRIITQEDWVVVKPNIVTSRSHKECSYWYEGRAHPGQVTDLRVMKSLVLYLAAQCRPRRITIAEGGAEWKKTGEPGTDPGQTEDGWSVHWPEFEGLSYEDIVAEVNEAYPGLVDIVDLNYDDFRFCPVPDPNGSGTGGLQRTGATVRPPEGFGREAYVPDTGAPREGYHIPETILNCDKLISVPAMKTHTCGATLGMKNYIGILPNHPSGEVRKGDIHKGDMQKGFVDLFSYHPSDYTVIEGFWSTEGNGPQWGEDLRHNVVVASADPVAADAVGAAVMGLNPWDLDCLHYGAAKGFGTFDLDAIEIVGKSIEAVERKFERAAGRKGIRFASRGNRVWLVRSEGGQAWQFYESEERYIDLDRHFHGGDVRKAQARVEVRSDGDQAGMLWASADGRMTVRLNGEAILERATTDGHQFAEHQIPIVLTKGLNLLEIDLERGPEGFGFTALLCDALGDTLRGIEYRVVASD